MYDSERELVNRLLSGAEIAKADGFDNTAAALVAIAKNLYEDILLRSAEKHPRSFKKLLDENTASSTQQKLAIC